MSLVSFSVGEKGESWWVVQYLPLYALFYLDLDLNLDFLSIYLLDHIIIISLNVLLQFIICGRS